MQYPNKNRSKMHLDLGIAQLSKEWKTLLTSKNLKEDALAGLTVACVALPLSLAIALASGVAPEKGIITAIVAGIICALFGGTPLAVSGPTTTMAILVGTAVQKYGLNSLLFIGLGCGLMQLLSGIFGIGRLVQFIPTPVVGGFTAGIGAIVLISQLPRAMGLPAPDQTHVISVFTHIKDSIFEIQPAALALCLGTLLITFALPRITKKIPAPMAAVVTATLISSLFGLKTELLGQISHSIPKVELPTWPAQDGIYLIGTSFIFFLLMSLETLLSSTAVDKLQSGKRHDSNQELIGQGIANVLSAILGGIPATGVTIRTALNIQAGAKTRRSSVIHSVVLIAAMLLCTPLIEKIPVASLAGIILFVALKMLNPKELMNLWRISKVEAMIYVLTSAVIVFVDLIAGVQAGLLAAFSILAIRLSQMRSHFHESEFSGPYRFSMHGPVTFMSTGQIVAIRTEIEKGEPTRGFIIDMSRVSMIDISGAEQIIELVELVATRGARVALVGLSPAHQKMLIASDRSGFIMRTFAVMESEVQQLLQGTEEIAPFDRLIFGVERFRKDSRLHYQPLFERLAYNQDPHTLFITCSDSRISPNLITSTDPGELFIVRNVGNMIPKHGLDDTPAEGAALEFSIAVLGVKEIVVCGHSGCGAMKAIVTHQPLSKLPNLEKWLSDGAVLRKLLPKNCSIEDAARYNALLQIENLMTYPIVQEKLKTGEIRIHAWFYDIGHGEIEEWDPEQDRFVRLGVSEKKPVEKASDPIPATGG